METRGEREKKCFVIRLRDMYDVCKTVEKFAKPGSKFLLPFYDPRGRGRMVTYQCQGDPAFYDEFTTDLRRRFYEYDATPLTTDPRPLTMFELMTEHDHALVQSLPVEDVYEKDEEQQAYSTFCSEPLGIA